MTARNAVDPDLWWHLRTGQWIVETGHIPRTDPFSFTHAGRTPQIFVLDTAAFSSLGKFACRIRAWRGFDDCLRNRTDAGDRIRRHILGGGEAHSPSGVISCRCLRGDRAAESQRTATLSLPARHPPLAGVPGTGKIERAAIVSGLNLACDLGAVRAAAVEEQFPRAQPTRIEIEKISAQPSRRGRIRNLLWNPHAIDVQPHSRCAKNSGRD